jgi:hypothetical protein
VSCPKETIFEKLKASRQYLMPLYVRCHIDGKPISRMLVDGGTAISSMSYSIFKKLGREDDELGKTNLMLNGVGETRWKPALSSAWSSLQGASPLLSCSSSLRCKVTIVLFLAAIGFTLIVVCPSTLHQFLI